MKVADETWEEQFSRYNFSTRAWEIMENFNVRYECYDAKDDFARMMRAGGVDDVDNIDDEDSVHGDNMDPDSFFEDGEEDLAAGVGPATQGIQDANFDLLGALRRAGWRAWDHATEAAKQNMKLPKIVIDASLNSGPWRNIVKVAKDRAW